MHSGRKLLLLSFILTVCFFIKYAIFFDPSVSKKSLSTSQEIALKKTPLRLRNTNDAAQSQASADSLEETFANINANSDRSWDFELDSNQRYIKTLRRGHMRSDFTSVYETSNYFLKQYGKKLFGVNPEDLFLETVDDNSEFKRVIYYQKVNGLTVYNSRLVFHYDKNGYLIHIAADLFPDEKPENHPKISQQNALVEAWRSLPNDAKKISQYSSPEKFSLITKAERLLYAAAGKSTEIYRFVVYLAPPLKGDYEVRVDDVTGRTLYSAYISRN